MPPSTWQIVPEPVLEPLPQSKAKSPGTTRKVAKIRNKNLPRAGPCGEEAMAQGEGFAPKDQSGHLDCHLDQEPTQATPPLSNEAPVLLRSCRLGDPIKPGVSRAPGFSSISTTASELLAGVEAPEVEAEAEAMPAVAPPPELKAPGVEQATAGLAEPPNWKAWQ